MMMTGHAPPLHDSAVSAAGLWLGVLGCCRLPVLEEPCVMQSSSVLASLELVAVLSAA